MLKMKCDFTINNSQKTSANYWRPSKNSTDNFISRERVLLIVSKKHSRPREMILEDLEKILAELNHAPLEIKELSSGDLSTQPQVIRRRRSTLRRNRARTIRLHLKSLRPNTLRSVAKENPNVIFNCSVDLNRDNSKVNLDHLKTINNKLIITRRSMERLEANVDLRNKLVNTLSQNTEAM